MRGGEFMNGLVIKGIANVGDMSFHHIEGGFGEGKRAMLVKEIAGIHGKEFKHINEAINNNRFRFTECIDVIDLKSVDIIDRDFLNKLGFSNSSIANSKNIFLLSERGYAKLLKILEDDFAWEQYDKIVDGYFNMRKSFNDQFRELSKEIQAIFVLDGKHQNIEKRMDKLEDTMTIDYSQQEVLRQLANKTVIDALGGKESLAYKKKNNTAFAEMWKYYKRTMNVNSYRNTAVKDFDKGKKVILNWKPGEDLSMIISWLNSQEQYTQTRL